MSVPTRYQWVGAAVNGSSTAAGNPDYDTVGFPPYLVYDGGDWMQTNSINFSTGATNPPLGPELVVNGDFSSSANWTLGTGASISGGVLSYSGGTSGNTAQSITNQSGQTYLVTFTIVSRSAGSVRVRFQGNAEGALQTAPGTYSLYTRSLATNSDIIVETNGAFVGTIDNVSVKELTDSNYAPDKMSVFAGVRKLVETTNPQVMLEVSSDWASNLGSFVLYSGNGNANYQIGVRGSSANRRQFISYPAPITNVVYGGLTTNAANSSDAITCRINASSNYGENVVTSSSTGNFGNYPLYIGARSGGAISSQYREYSTIVLGRAVNATELANTEDYMETQTFGKNMAYVYSDELTTSLGDLITAADGDQIYMQVSYV